MRKAIAVTVGLLLIGSSAHAAGVLTARARQTGASVLPVTLSLRGGVMFAPKRAALGGVDIAMPGISLAEGWEGRLDADAIVKASFAGVKTVVPVTFSQVRYIQDVSGRALYYGVGAGALLGGKAKVVGKGIVGTELIPRLGVEGNVFVTNDRTIFTVVGRLHL